VQVVRVALRGLRCLTMPRHPLARIVSDHRCHQRSPPHPLHAEVAVPHPDRRAFLEMPEQTNRMARHRVPARQVREERAAGSIACIRERYVFRGVQERYELTFRTATALVAWPRRPVKRKRMNEAAPLTPGLIRRIEVRNTPDFSINDDFGRGRLN
jgi:hypothetical protein